MPRGGRRDGQIGKVYSNRSDLNTPKGIPIINPTGAPYGDKQALVSSQQAMPPGPPPPPQGAPVGNTSAGSPPGVGPGQSVQLPDFGRPTERPGEPVTHGLPVGAGGGPEVLGPSMAGNTLAGLIKALAASAPLSPDVQALAQLAARQPGAGQ